MKCDLRQRAKREMRWKARHLKNSSLIIARAYNTLTKKPMEFKESLFLFAAVVQ